jgi:rhodanese-related sulfurtransferase
MEFKQMSFTILLIFLLFSCTDNWKAISIENTKEDINIEINEIKQVLKRVWLADFKLELSKNDYSLIDLRTSWELMDTWVIPWAMQIDFYASDFKDKLSALDKNKKYLIYCRSWSRSGQTLSVLKTLGFINVVELEWWINMWLNWWENTEQFINN